MNTNINPASVQPVNSFVLNKFLEKNICTSFTENNTFSSDKTNFSAVATASPASASKISGDVPKESVFQKIKHSLSETAGDVVVDLGKISVLNKLGYWLYGQATKPEDELKDKNEDKPMGNIGYLNKNLIRGSQPREDDFPKLKQMGVNTVINLRPEENWEKPMVEKNGMKEIYLPLPAIGRPSNQQALQFLSAVTDPANGKVFFHCLHGADRTGAMAAAYHIATEGWNADQAIAEMPKYNFHAGFEDDKLDFIKGFASYWQNLPESTKAQVLHKS